MTLGISMSVSAAKVYVPDRAVKFGNLICYCLGVDGGGPLYSYDPASRSTQLILDERCHQLTASGSYLYFRVDSYHGSDASSRYIYRIKPDGTKAKRLASGTDPVVIGKYIYYIALTKTPLYGTYVDGEILGVYRMKLNGTGKKLIYASTELKHLYRYGNKKLAFTENNEVYFSMTTAGRKVTYFDPSSVSANTNNMVEGHDLEGRGFSKICYNAKGIYYTFDKHDDTLFRYSKGVEKRITAFDGMVIRKVIDLDQYLVVIAEYLWQTPDHTSVPFARMYLMKRNGRKRVTLTEVADISGGW